MGSSGGSSSQLICSFLAKAKAGMVARLSLLENLQFMDASRGDSHGIFGHEVSCGSGWLRTLRLSLTTEHTLSRHPCVIVGPARKGAATLTASLCIVGPTVLDDAVASVA
jgi:hypothetical protein